MRSTTVSRRSAMILAAFAGGWRVAFAGSAAPRAGAVPPTMSRGFNLPDQVPLRAGRRANPRLLQLLRHAGMTHVRLPVVAENVLPQFSGPATISSAMDDLDRAVEALLAMGYGVSVDIHPGAEFQNMQRREPNRGHRDLLEGWRQIARRISTWPPAFVFAELLNEPAESDATWRPFVEELAKAVRAILPNNYIIVGSAPFQRVEALAEWAPLADKNIVYACHYYDPMMFTHQGASWESDSPWTRVEGLPFPSFVGDRRLLELAADFAGRGDEAIARELRQMAEMEWSAVKILAHFQKLAEWSQIHAAPIIVNEFGVLKWKAKRADRLAWITAVRASAEACGFGWTHWDYDAGFGLLEENGQIDDGVLRALIPTRGDGSVRSLGESARSAAPSDKATSPMTTGKESGAK
jgi:endoglucanase